MKHIIYDQLLEKKIINPTSMSLFYKGTRDDSSINAYQCSDSGIIILDEIKTTDAYYTDNVDYASDHLNLDTHISTSFSINDDYRRYLDYQELFKENSILDFGCGQGNLAKYLKGYDIETVELNKKNRTHLNNSGIKCYSDLRESERLYDIIILNHVFEHLNDLNYFLKLFYSYLKPEGRLIIEVPSADDFLIKSLKLNSFISFTLWSEHLVLWTENSLNKFVTQFGFETIKSIGYQRYPFSNHFGWIKNGKPGGHELYSNYNQPILNDKYIEMLKGLKQTDTIIASFKKL